MDNSLVQIAIFGFFGVIVAGAIVLIVMDIKGSGTPVDMDAMRVRFGAAILTGILILFMVVITMFYSNPTNEAASKIFDRTITALSPLVGVLIAYFFKK